jgi:uncharacterized membrane protein
MLPFRLLVPISEQPPALQFLRSVVSGIGVSFTSALVTALVWWVGIRRLFDRGRSARGAQTAFLASFVLGIVFLPLGLYSTALQNGVHEHGAWHFLVSPALTGLSEFVYLATMWVCWVAVSEGGSPVAALARGLALAWRRRLDFAVLIARVAVVLAPLRVFQLALSDVPVWGTWLLLSVLGSVVVLALLVATGLAYASLTDQFPSAIPQAGEEALPPNLPGDIPIAH